MTVSKQDFARYIREFNFHKLFIEMGWNNDNAKEPIVIDGFTYYIDSVAEKNGFKILKCSPDENGKVPDYQIRRKIENKVTRLFQEHLIIYCDSDKKNQIWQCVLRQAGKPSKLTETRYNISQDPELLFQKASGLGFELDEEEKITIVDVKKRVSDNFHRNNEKVTKQFYEKFKKEHTSFLAFIKGIEDNVSKDWYASLMLNRLMFCYFIQKKGFLDRNKDYLKDKLKECQSKNGKNKFYSFYRNFLLSLFHKGLGSPEHSKSLVEEIGRVPYLNGGLFDEHDIEKKYDEIVIDDKAFERIFDFFDQYEWHLDTRITASGKDINPDVIGYIFEKYINDRAQMGAYYTKEDITEYISKNCIIPYVFDETARLMKIKNEKMGIGELTKPTGDKYIYDSVKKGIEISLPENISKGIKNVSKRNDWNKPAPEEFALPTEIWREVVERRNRYYEIKGKIESGEVNSINDFITYNLNIRQFAQDVIEETNDSDFIKSFYKAITNVTILDPTCGSGAFLFAAMNILEPLYGACLQRMENIVNESKKGKHKFFEDTLAIVIAPEHPNLQYFIYKSIILNNLYGVDIMNEAVEIAKLRLFLKLIATVEANYTKPNLGLEPLPDIDFNIRTGNTLIGFATEEDLNNGLTYNLGGLEIKSQIEDKCELVAKAFARYKEIQLFRGEDFNIFKKSKENLNKRLIELNNELNILLHKQYSSIKFDKWLINYQPFHWFAEFYEIIQEKKGFDVIIGNPPYIEYRNINKKYEISNYKTFDCKNLFAYVFERSFNILKLNCYISLIIPLSAIHTSQMIDLQNILLNNTSYLSAYCGDTNPSVLFNGARMQLLIVNLKKNFQKFQYITKYLRFYSEERGNLFDSKIFFNLCDKTNLLFPGSIAKIENLISSSIIHKLSMKSGKKRIANYISNFQSHSGYYLNSISYFTRTFIYPPLFNSNISSDIVTET